MVNHSSVVVVVVPAGRDQKTLVEKIHRQGATGKFDVG